MSVTRSNVNSVVLFLMGKKGYLVLKSCIDKRLRRIEAVVCSRDSSMLFDFYQEIKILCKKSNINFLDRTDQVAIDELESTFFLAVSWRWLISSPTKNIIIFHDSLLPRYRGFAPLINSLINGENYLGVTALLADNFYDRGPIVKQSSIQIDYPLKINDAIDKISNLYVDLVEYIYREILAGRDLSYVVQNEVDASYSLWRDYEDFFINWNLDSGTILRTVNALGFPYTGALTRFNDQVAKVVDAEEVSDVRVENRDTGKVVFVERGCPIVVCGTGLLKINSLISLENSISLLPLNKFRVRFF